MFQGLKTAVKFALTHTPYGRFLGHRWAYNFSPRQLCFLSGCIDRTATLTGAIVEVGCFVGHTSVWLSKHMQAEGLERPYYALDTFAGFVPGQLEHEVHTRGKGDVRGLLTGAFRGNSKFFFDRQMAWNQLSQVTSIQADAATFDFATLGPLSFVLIDVDLYLPVKAALEKIIPLMQPGGIVVVDDCTANNYYDGALQAYEEFTAEHGLPGNILHGKLGVIET